MPQIPRRPLAFLDNLSAIKIGTKEEKGFDWVGLALTIGLSVLLIIVVLKLGQSLLPLIGLKAVV